MQFPLKFTYNITVNKAHGQTLRYCGTDLKESCFSHGQLYVGSLLSSGHWVVLKMNVCIYLTIRQQI